jgi:uncharacterized protein (DUF2252 family)
MNTFISGAGAASTLVVANITASESGRERKPLKKNQFRRQYPTFVIGEKSRAQSAWANRQLSHTSVKFNQLNLEYVLLSLIVMGAGGLVQVRAASGVGAPLAH